MMLTVLLAAVACAALLPIALPLLRGRTADADRAASDQIVYRDQLAELDRDVARGLLTAAEVAASRLEIQRRLLAAARTPPRAVSVTASPILGLAVIAMVSVGSIGLYTVLSAPLIQPDPGGEQRAEVERMVARIRERLTEDPRNAEGWRLLGRTTGALGDWTAAIDAYQRAIGLGDGTADTRAALGEVLVARANGTIIPAARQAFHDALTIEPGHGMSRYYLALAAGQDGKPREGIEAMLALAGEIPADSPVRAEIGRQVATLAAQAGIAPAALPSPAGPAPAPGPDQATMEAAANLPAADRAQMIRTMVARLAERLEANPDDVEGWLRLGRSRMVLGEKESAADALERAAILRPGDFSIPLQAVEALLTGLAITDPLPPRAIAILHRIEAVRPDEPAVLWYLGLVAAREGRKPDALSYWRRLRDGLPAGHPDTEMVRSAIQALEAPRPGQ